MGPEKQTDGAAFEHLVQDMFAVEEEEGGQPPSVDEPEDHGSDEDETGGTEDAEGDQ